MPRAEPPAWISTGLPCGEGGVFSGPFTLKKRPTCSTSCSLDGSPTRPVAWSHSITSGSALSHRARQTSTNSCMRS